MAMAKDDASEDRMVSLPHLNNVDYGNNIVLTVLSLCQLLSNMILPIHIHPLHGLCPPLRLDILTPLCSLHYQGWREVVQHVLRRKS